MGVIVDLFVVEFGSRCMVVVVSAVILIASSPAGEVGYPAVSIDLSKSLRME